LYLKFFSEELRKAGRTHLDSRWVISPVGGVDKIASFVTLFSCNKLDVAVLADIHKGLKNKMRSLRESVLLKEGRVFTADTYAGQEEADIEDIIGRGLYVHLVNKCYALSKGTAIIDNKPGNAPMRVVEEVANHFAVLPPENAQYDHYAPAVYLVENGHGIRGTLPGYEQALSRFEKLFVDLNHLLPKT